VTSIVILLSVVAIMLVLSLEETDGHLIYGTDDAYIHMAMAKNFAQDGVWGVTKYAFTYSSSSLLWTLALSATYFVFGTNELGPFILNNVLAVFLIALSYVFLMERRPLPPRWYIFLILCSIIFLTPVPVLIFTGQEHILHIIMTTAFLYLSGRIISKERDDFRSIYLAVLLILIPLLPFTRFEGLFLIFAFCVFLFFRKLRLYSLLTGILSLTLVGISGVISVRHGWYVLPNSILLKTGAWIFASGQDMGTWLLWQVYNLVATDPALISLVIIGALLLALRRYRCRGICRDENMAVSIFTGMALLHMFFSSASLSFRYEAYLIAAGTFIIGPALFDDLPQLIRDIPRGKFKLPACAALCILLLVSSLLLAKRGARGLAFVPKASRNVYQQQYQMGLFLKRSYETLPVALNDIGAVNYLADIRCLDVYGIGSKEVGRQRMEATYNQASLHDISRLHEVKIAIVYDDWLEQLAGIPPQWIKVGEWEIEDNVVCGGETVSFYAVDTSEKKNLMANLSQFSHSLPKGVTQRGEFLRELSFQN